MNYKVTDNMRNFQVTVYDVAKVNDIFSKGRVRIFYKGINRNHTYISDAFAEELIASLPYTPVKGIFNEDGMDFEDHGWESRDSKIYGIVPENPNFAWEDCVDEDGVMHTYACADVYLFTSLYPEAKLIQGKGQSMEIYDKTMKGHWTDSQEGEIFVFDHGSLLGLQVLGDNVEPCFEDAMFYSLSQDVQSLMFYIKKFENEVKKSMEKEKVTAQDVEKEATSQFTIIEKNDGNGICLDNTTQEYVTVHFLDDGAIQETARFASLYEALRTQEQAIAELTEKLETPQEDTTFEVEPAAEEVSDAVDVAVEELSEVVDTAVEELSEVVDTAVEELSEVVDTAVEENPETSDYEVLQRRVEELENEIARQKGEIFKLSQEKDDILKERADLQAFKQQVETETKQKILDEFSEYLSTTQITQYTEQMGKFTADEFKKELCVAAYDSGRMQASKEDLVYKLQDNEKIAETGVMGLLNKHKKRG